MIIEDKFKIAKACCSNKVLYLNFSIILQNSKELDCDTNVFEIYYNLIVYFFTFYCIIELKERA